MIKVSIIIPIYNMGIYLEECLQSVLSQSLREIEVICINDGSTDNSTEILEKYASKYSNVIIIEQENLGVAKSRNNGINIAKGEFVAFMDPDDFYPYKDILECLYDSAKNNNVSICGGSLCGFRDRLIKKYYGDFRDYSFYEDKKVYYKEYQLYYGFTRFIYNLNFLKENNLYFPSYSRFQDPPFFVQAMICAGEFYSIKKITYCYREGHKKVNLTLEKTIDYAKGILDLLNISRYNKLKKLHRLIHSQLINALLPAIYRNILEEDKELEDLIYKINSAIDISFLEERKELQDYFILEPNEISNYMKKIMEKENDFINTLYKYKEIIIYGAGKVGVVLGNYLKASHNINIVSYAVTDVDNNPKKINGIVVRNINNLTIYKEDALVLIGTYSNLHGEIKNTLKQLNFKNIIAINYNDLMLFNNIEQ